MVFGDLRLLKTENLLTDTLRNLHVLLLESTVCILSHFGLRIHWGHSHSLQFCECHMEKRTTSDFGHLHSCAKLYIIIESSTPQHSQEDICNANTHFPGSPSSCYCYFFYHLPVPPSRHLSLPLLPPLSLLPQKLPFQPKPRDPRPHPNRRSRLTWLP